MISGDFKILLVDDENDILEFVSYNLKKEGYQVYTCNNGKDAINLAIELEPHLIILDVMMPQMDGMETCMELRTIKKLDKTLIAFLTARNEDYSQLAGFNAGADDYISKPIKPSLLVSRVKALLRRASGDSAPSEAMELGNLVIDKERYIVIFNNIEITLPKKEFELLSLLASKPNKVFTRDEIFSKVWGDNVIVGDRTIDVHVRKLREKIGIDNIKTIKGVGYKYEV
ncbi:MAG: response regulator transcription factor [Bacteroidales bacterium]|nr:response regulator transcription factor [Bacteroidales bacterium]